MEVYPNSVPLDSHFACVTASREGEVSWIVRDFEVLLGRDLGPLVPDAEHSLCR